VKTKSKIIAVLLVSLGIVLISQLVWSQTPLHLVVTSGNTNAIQLLLDFKADVNATDNTGKTPLALLEDLKIAQFRSGRGIRMIDFKAVENLLLKNGAKGPVLTPDPKTAPQVIN
jgi:hypothetical protein